MQKIATLPVFPLLKKKRCGQNDRPHTPGRRLKGEPAYCKAFLFGPAEAGGKLYRPCMKWRSRPTSYPVTENEIGHTAALFLSSHRAFGGTRTRRPAIGPDCAPHRGHGEQTDP